MEQRKVRVMRRFKCVVLQEEVWKMSGCPDTPMEVYRNHAGDNVDCRFGKRRPGLVRVIEKRGIVPEKTEPEHCTCSIGRDAKGAWWGWSHRAMVGFRKGDRIFEGRFPGATDKTPLRKHGRRTIKTDADGKLAATRFAKFVS